MVEEEFFFLGGVGGWEKGAAKNKVSIDFSGK